MGLSLANEQKQTNLLERKKYSMKIVRRKKCSLKVVKAYHRLKNPEIN